MIHIWTTDRWAPTFLFLVTHRSTSNLYLPHHPSKPCSRSVDPYSLQNHSPCLDLLSVPVRWAILSKRPLHPWTGMTRIIRMKRQPGEQEIGGEMVVLVSIRRMRMGRGGFRFGVRIRG